MKRTTKNAATTEPKYVIPESEQSWKSRYYQTLLAHQKSFKALSICRAFCPRGCTISEDPTPVGPEHLCTSDGQLPFKTSTWLLGSCTGGERSRRAQPRWRRPRGTKDLCEDAQGQLPCTRSQKLLRHACCRPGFSLPPVEWKKNIAKGTTDPGVDCFDQ